MSISKVFFSTWRSEAGEPPLVGCPRLLIQFIRSYPPYRRPFLQPHPEDAPCRGDRDPQTRENHISQAIYTLGRQTAQILVINTLVHTVTVTMKPLTRHITLRNLGTTSYRETLWPTSDTCGITCFVTLPENNHS